jgi:hypothetical protein
VSVRSSSSTTSTPKYERLTAAGTVGTHQFRVRCGSTCRTMNDMGMFDTIIDEYSDLTGI